MAKASSIPRYSLHRASGQARVVIAGRHHYLGKHGTAESLERYHRLLAEHAAGTLAPIVDASPSITVVELCCAYWEHARAYYQKNGRATGQTFVVKSAIRALRETHGHTLAAEFGPRAMAAIQMHLVGRDNCRTYVNKLASQIRQIFKWAVARELVPVTTYQAILTVEGLKAGRTTARESMPIRPVSDETVDATLATLPPVVRDMVKLQRLLGCRPGEICSLRPCDVDRSSDVWEYRPARHKTQHHGHERVIFVGPKAQMILRGYLDDRPTGAFCFSPRDSQTIRYRQMRAARRSKVQPSQVDRRKARPQRTPRESYDATSYARAISRACDAAFPVDEAWPEEKQREWRRAHRWHPNQLRHSVATAIRKKFGLEGAQVVLGHASADVTQVYAERDAELARSVMREVG